MVDRRREAGPPGGEPAVPSDELDNPRGELTVALAEQLSRNGSGLNPAPGPAGSPPGQANSAEAAFRSRVGGRPNQARPNPRREEPMRRTVIPFLSTCAVRVAPIAQGILQAGPRGASEGAFRPAGPSPRRKARPQGGEGRDAPGAGILLGRRDQAVSAEIARAFRWKAP